MFDRQEWSRQELIAYDQQMLRSNFVILFWRAFEKRRDEDGYSLTQLAQDLGKDKSVISRWFKGDPNWTVDTIAEIASVMGLELCVDAREIGRPDQAGSPDGFRRPGRKSEDLRRLEKIFVGSPPLASHRRGA